MNTPDLEELERRLDDHPNCHSLGVAPEKLRALIAKARESDELRAEVERLTDLLEGRDRFIVSKDLLFELVEWLRGQPVPAALGEAK